MHATGRHQECHQCCMPACVPQRIIIHHGVWQETTRAGSWTSEWQIAVKPFCRAHFITLVPSPEHRLTLWACLQFKSNFLSRARGARRACAIAFALNCAFGVSSERLPGDNPFPPPDPIQIALCLFSSSFSE